MPTFIRRCLAFSFVVAFASLGVSVAKASGKLPVTWVDGAKTILVAIPWADLFDAVRRAADPPQPAIGTSKVTLTHIKGDSKLIVAEAQITTQVTKWQEQAYGSITIKTDVVSRVTYTMDLKDLHLRWDDEKKVVVAAIPEIQVDGIEYKSWEPTVTFTRLRKWFSSDTRAALEAQIRETVKAEVREEAEKYLTDVRVKYLKAFREASEEQMKELSPGIKVVFE